MLSGQCYESTRALPYRPWIDVLESRLAQLSDQALRTLSPFWLEQLARLVPTLNARLSRRAATAAPTAGVEVEHLFGAVNAMLSSPSPRPLLIFIDNLQWADEASLRLFQSVARRSRNASTLLIGTFRSEEAADSPALQSLLGDLRRDGLTHLRLAPPVDDFSVPTVGRTCARCLRTRRAATPCLSAKSCASWRMEPRCRALCPCRRACAS